ncbi:MAG: HD-GYP domain-containing protein [Candidatus Omnitrophica bacterium]|nr:HD-GYP domain-containing protein [Candidatus Omnitrophota bacterium]
MDPVTISVGVSLFLTGMATAAGYARSLSKQLQNRELEVTELKSQMLEWSKRLEEKVAETSKRLETATNHLNEADINIVTSLVEATVAKDYYLSSHCHNVAVYAKAVAREMGLPMEKIDRLVQGCKLHDLGKIAVPDQLLLKPGPLTPEEFEIVKQHVTWGARILAPLPSLKDVYETVLQEHERWDGKGYPNGLKANEILLEARIVAVADALDAMLSDRPYRKHITVEQAAEELKRCAGTQFDPQIVEACAKAMAKKKLIPSGLASLPTANTPLDQR